ncbi:MAG: hypothetical protein AAGJ56_02870 [Myxococcota bacterium]
MADAISSLRRFAQNLENPGDRQQAEALVDRLSQAQGDGDEAIHIDEHFSAEVAARELMYRFAPDSSEHAFVRQLRETMWSGYDEESNLFTPYRLAAPEGQRFEARPAGPSFEVGRDEAATYVTVPQFERLLGERYEVDRGLQAGVAVDNASQVFGQMQVTDRVDGRAVAANQLASTLSAELFLQSRLRIGVVAETPSELDFVSLLHGQDGAGVRDWNRLRLPEYLSQRPIDARGSRLTFLVAEDLARQGRLAEDDVRAWIAEDDAAAATDAVLEHVEFLNLGAYNGYETAFARGFDVDDDGMAYDRMRYALEHGIVIFSHDEDMDQVLPDYQYDEGAVRTPTGPAMLVFDAPIAELSTEEIHEAWPGKRDYLFGLDSIDIVLDPHATQAHFDAARSTERSAIGSADLSSDVDAMYNRMNELVAILRRNPNPEDFASQDERLRASYDVLELLDQVEPIVQQAEAELRSVQAEQSRIEYRNADRRGLRVDGDEVRALRERADELQAFVDQARAVRGFGRRAIAVYFNQGEERPDPEALLARVERASQSGLGVERAAAVIRAQQELIGTRQSVRLERAFSRQDHEELDAYVPWYRDWLIPDYVLHGLFFGTSVDGRLVRESGDALDVDDTLLQSFSSAYDRGEVQALREVDHVLGQESEQYVADRAELRAVQPVFLQLEEVGRGAGSASGALRAAQTAIMMRNITPPTVTRTYTTSYTDGNGNTQFRTETRTEPNPAYYMYVAMAASASSRAETEVQALNGNLEELRRMLTSEGFTSRFGGEIDQNIDWLTGTLWGSWFFGSFDSWDVDRMQRQLGQVLNELEPVVGEVGPVYAEHRSAVSRALSTRRAELLGGA